MEGGRDWEVASWTDGGGMECYGWEGCERMERERKGGVERVKKKGLEETKKEK